MIEQSTVRTSYPVPAGDEMGLSPEEAGQAVKQLMADAGGDKKHPYSDGNHPLHRDFVQHVQRLLVRKNEAPGAAMSPAERAMEQALADQQGKAEITKETLSTAAKMQLARLAKVGFDVEGVDPDTVQPHQLKAWGLQALLAEGNHKALMPMLAKELGDLRASPDVMQAFDAFAGIQNIDPDLRAGIVGQVIEYLYAANSQRQGKVR